MATATRRTVHHPDGSRSIVVDLVIDTSRFDSALARVEATLALLDAARDRRRRHWVRHHPDPLLIDGHAYRRRTLARRRRNR